MWVDGSPPPETIAEMKAEADAVVIGTYWGERPVAVSKPISKPVQRTLLPPSPFSFDTDAAPGIPTSLHVFEIQELAKPHPLLPHRRTFELELFGAVEEHANGIFPQLRTR